MGKKLKKNLLLLPKILIFFTAFLITALASRAVGPVIVPRVPLNPSINEPIVGASAGVKQNVSSAVGKVPASYSWFNFFGAIGSAIQPFTANPTWAGQKSGQTQTYAGLQEFVSRFFPGVKEIGGKNVIDIPRLGVACGNSPGDPYWVGYPRIGNIEFAPPYQWAHDQYDCFCRCDELIECPIGPKEVRHYNHGGTNRNLMPCQVCFGLERIVKHDKYVGVSHGAFPGYPIAFPNDPGYQECLRQSPESFSASGPGGVPIPFLYGI